MFQIYTLNFRLILARRSINHVKCQGNYYLELTGETPFDLTKNFSEKFFCGSAGTPFYHIEDVALFSEEMAAFWKLRLDANPKLIITSIEELKDIWKKLAANLYSSNSVAPKLLI